MKKTPIGHVHCPVCNFEDAEVKTDKNDHSYIHCTDCNAQAFTRNEYRDGKLRAKMRAVPVTVTEPVPAAAAAAAAAKKEAPAAVKKSGSWFQPIIGSMKHE